jgi:hypothetical protein
MPQNYDYPWSQPYPLPLVSQPSEHPHAAAEGVVPVAPAGAVEKPLVPEARERSERIGGDGPGNCPPEGAYSFEEHEWMLLL